MKRLKFCIAPFAALLLLLAGCADEKSTQSAAGAEYTAFNPEAGDGSADTTAFTREEAELPKASDQAAYGSPYKEVAAPDLAQRVMLYGLPASRTVYGRKGGVFHFPDSCLLDQKGRPVYGSAELRIVEADDQETYAKLKMSARADESVLEIDGMFFLEARKDGKPLKISEKAPLDVKIPRRDDQGQYQCYYGKRAKDGGASWKLVGGSSVIAPRDTQQDENAKDDFEMRFLAYSAFDSLKPALGTQRYAFFEQLKSAADWSPCPKGRKYEPFEDEAEALKAGPCISPMELSYSPYFWIEHQLYTSKKEAVDAIETISGKAVKPVVLPKPALLKKDDAVFYEVTPAFDPMQRAHAFATDFPRFKDSRLTLPQLKAAAQAAAEAYESRERDYSEAQLRAKVDKDRSFGKRPEYAWVDGKFYANNKAFRQFIGSFDGKDAAVADGYVRKPGFGDAGLRAGFMEIDGMMDDVKDLARALEGYDMLPDAAPVHELTAAAEMLWEAMEAPAVQAPDLPAYFWVGDRFLAHEAVFPALADRAARLTGGSAPDAKQLLARLRDLYPAPDTRNKYLRHAYLDMSAAVMDLDYRDYDEKLLIYQLKQLEDYDRAAARQAAAAYHHYRVRAFGWYACARPLEGEPMALQGRLLNAGDGAEVVLIDLQAKTCLTAQADADGVYRFRFLKGRPFRIEARKGDAYVGKDFDLDRSMAALSALAF